MSNLHTTSRILIMNKIPLPRRSFKNREQSVEGEKVSLKTQAINISAKLFLFTRTPLLAFHQKQPQRFIFLPLPN